MNLETFKRRSAEKLIALGQAILEQDTPRNIGLTRPPNLREYQILTHLAELGPRKTSAIWAGTRLFVSGAFGEFVVPKQDLDRLVDIGALTRDAELTEEARKYLGDPEIYFDVRDAA